MKAFRSLIICLGCAVMLPAMAAGEAPGDYSGLRPEGQIEAAPAALGRGVLVEMSGVIEDVDMSTRLVSIKGPEGNVLMVEAGPAVKNLDQIEKGDRVTMKYYQSMAVDVIASGDEKVAPKVEVETAEVAAERGAKPAGLVVRQERATVKILSVDPYKKVISFYDKEGRYREVSMDEPRLEHYLKELKDGDTVEVVFTEALAASITEQ